MVIRIKSSINKEREVLPEFEFVTLQGTGFTTDNIIKGRLVIIVFFNSECCHCINEVENLIKNAASFKDHNILLVSEQPLSKLAQFYSEYKLNKYPQIKLLHADYQYFIALFGTADVPTTIIYDESYKLQRLFKGEVSIEVIKKFVINT